MKRTLRRTPVPGVVGIAAISSMALLTGCGSTPAAWWTTAPSCPAADPSGLQVACPSAAVLTSEQPIDVVRLQPDGQTLLLTYAGGDEAPTAAHPWGCAFLDGVRTSDSAASVTVTIVLGTRPKRATDGTLSGCVSTGVGRTTEVRLEHPLGGRALYDGGHGGAPIAVTR